MADEGIQAFASPPSGPAPLNVSLSCQQPAGDGPFEYEWFKNGISVQKGQNITEHITDHGTYTYTCKAFGGDPNPQEASVTVVCQK